jgi:chaperonin GroEL
LRCVPAIDALNLKDTDEQIGVEIVKRAIEYPTKFLASNGGSKVGRRPGGEEAQGQRGFNAATGDYEDLVKAGVVDPKKVTRTGAAKRRVHRRTPPHHRGLITEVPEKDKPSAPAGHGPGGGGMDY